MIIIEVLQKYCQLIKNIKLEIKKVNSIVDKYFIITM